MYNSYDEFFEEIKRRVPEVHDWGFGFGGFEVTLNQPDPNYKHLRKCVRFGWKSSVGITREEAECFIERIFKVRSEAAVE
jgi:hypothetical protein